MYCQTSAILKKRSETACQTAIFYADSRSTILDPEEASKRTSLQCPYAPCQPDAQRKSTHERHTIHGPPAFKGRLPAIGAPDVTEARYGTPSKLPGLMNRNSGNKRKATPKSGRPASQGSKPTIGDQKQPRYYDDTPHQATRP